IDFEFSYTATQHVFKRGYIGLFWANYINAPEDKSMYLRGKNLWLQHCSPAHNAMSTVLYQDEKFDMTFVKDHKETLYKNFSPLKYELPLFYGLFRKHILIVMFERPEGIRISHSPSGGGMNTAAQTTLPAWDFQYVLPKYEVNTPSGFKARLIYRE